MVLDFVRYLSRFHAQETCHWRQEEGLEKEAKVSSCFIWMLDLYSLLISLLSSVFCCSVLYIYCVILLMKLFDGFGYVMDEK